MSVPAAASTGRAPDGPAMAAMSGRSLVRWRAISFALRLAAGLLLVHGTLVLLFPPALTGRLAVPVSVGSPMALFHLVEALVLPRWLVWPCETGLAPDQARLAGLAEVGLAAAAILAGRFISRRTAS